MPQSLTLDHSSVTEIPCATSASPTLPWTLAASASSVILLLTGAQALLMLGIGRSGLHYQSFTVAEKLSHLGFETLCMSAGVGAITIFIGIAVKIVRPVCARSKWIAAIGWIFLYVLSCALLQLIAISWGSFQTVGTFLDREAFAFWAPQPIQVLHWVPPALFYGVPPVMLASAALIGVVLPRWLHRQSRSLRKRIAYSVCLMLLAATGFVRFGTPSGERVNARIDDEIAGTSYLLGEEFEDARCNRIGPFSHAAADMAQWIQQRPAMLSDDTSIASIERPIITLDQYAAQVDPVAFKKLNVLIVLVESLRADELRIYGGGLDVMPSVDALARESVVFQDAYAQATHSNYADPCPLSGHYPMCADHTHIYPRDPTYPRVFIFDILKKLGYRTSIFSSQNELWGQMATYYDTGGLDVFQHAENWGGPTYVARTDTAFASWVTQTEHAGSIDDRYTIDEAIRWIGNDSRPFFMHLMLQSSHFPYTVGDDFKRPFGPDQLDFAMSFNNYPQDKVDVVRARYRDSLNYMDQQIGRLFEHLKQQGKWDDTIVIVSGDTGQAFYEHGFSAHGNKLYEELVRVPLVIKVPAEAKRIEANRPAQHVDVPPTILHLLGLPAHPSFQGSDLFTEDFPTDRSIFLTVHTPLSSQYAIVQGRHKLIYDQRSGKNVLYDLHTDPGEKHDQSAEQPEIAQRLSARLQTWRARQIEYYRSAWRQKQSYPPVLVETADPALAQSVD